MAATAFRIDSRGSNTRDQEHPPLDIFPSSFGFFNPRRNGPSNDLLKSKSSFVEKYVSFSIIPTFSIIKSNEHVVWSFLVITIWCFIGQLSQSHSRSPGQLHCSKLIPFTLQFSLTSILMTAGAKDNFWSKTLAAIPTITKGLKNMLGLICQWSIRNECRRLRSQSSVQKRWLKQCELVHGEEFGPSVLIFWSLSNIFWRDGHS